ncbi:pyrroloquinoline quinone precursor peptide PqqA [Streptomyces sp. NPDC050485]
MKETSEETAKTATTVKAAKVAVREAPEYTVVETALEVTGYFHADR